MKTQIISGLGLGFTLAMLPFVGGCNQQTNDTPQSLVTAAQAEPVFSPVAETNVPAPIEPAGVAVAPVEKPEVVTTPPVPTVPSSINPSSALAEVVKLAQAGVDETVLYAFVTNSTSIFGLGSDEIIYLNDLGLSGPLVTTMIEHDQAVKQYWTNRAQAQTAAAAATNATPAPETASGPAYINPPQPEPAPQPQPVQVSNNYFQETLSPYGSWVNVSGYGLCWRPTVAVVNPGWQPYADRGHWVYSDAGWYWLSDYSWGATTFHYGRWFNQPNVGWCWWPDTVWAPSWVSWRYSSDYCGWAPLPPTACYRPGFGFTYYGNSVGVSFGFGLSANCYTFVPTAYFCSPRPCNYRVPAHHANGFYNQTVVANNYIVGNNNTIINNGIPVAQVAATTRTEIRPVPIREAGAGFRHGGRGERLEPGGRSLAVHRPNWQNTPDSTATAVASGSAPSPTLQPVGSPRANNPGSSLSGPRSSQRGEFGSANRRGQFGGNPTTTPPTGTATEVTTTPAPQYPSVTRPDSRSDRSRPDNNLRSGPARNSGGGTSPLIIRGSGIAAQPTAPTTLTAPTAPTPASSVTVIGKRDDSASQSRNGFAPSASRNRSGRPATSTSTFSANPVPNQSAPAPVVTAPSVAPTAPSQFTSSASPYQRQQSQRATHGFERRAAPTTTYSAPPPVPQQSAPPAPNYSAPASPYPSVAQSAPLQPSSRGFSPTRNANDTRRGR